MSNGNWRASPGPEELAETMSRAIDDPQAARHLRGLILRLIYLNHNAQRKRLTSTVIRGTLEREGWGFDPEDVITMLQDLKERGYIRFKSVRVPVFPNVHLFEIELLPPGRDLCDGIGEDAAVQVQ